MNILKLLWKFTKFSKYGLMIQAALCIFWSLKEALFPYFLKNIVNALSLGSSASHLSYVYVQIASLVILWSLMEIAMRMQGYFASKIFPILRGKVREYIYERLSLRTMEYKQSMLSGDLASKISELPKAVEQVFEIIYLHIPSIGCAFIIGSYLLFKVSALFGAVTLGWVFLHILLSVLFAKYCIRNTFLHAKSETLLLGRISDLISNRLTSHLYSSSSIQLENLRKYQHAEIEQANKARMAVELPKYFQSVLAIAFMSTMLFLLTSLWQKNKVTVGDFALVPMLCYNIVGMVTWFSYLINIFLKQIGFIKASAEIQDSSKDLSVSNVGAGRSDVGRIEFRNVSFQHSGHDPLLKNITISINPIEKIALVGDSGAGKTTLLKIIAGIQGGYSGTVHLDQEHTSLIPQLPEFFHATIFENIILGQSNISMSDVVKFTKLVEAHDFIESFPDSYQTIVGEKGYNLSVGQAQRIMLVRVLLRNRKILMLDESTSALDAKTEKRIFDNLKDYLKDKTVIIATHHQRSLVNVDRVLHLKNGQISEEKINLTENKNWDRVIS
jgi:ABC-type multidrug transport system fused ATPase/permease subunit